MTSSDGLTFPCTAVDVFGRESVELVNWLWRHTGSNPVILIFLNALTHFVFIQKKMQARCNVGALVLRVFH